MTAEAVGDVLLLLVIGATAVALLAFIAAFVLLAVLVVRGRWKTLEHLRQK